MKYKIIRLSDQVEVASFDSKEEADKQIIFYDTENEPHKVQPDSEEE